MTLYETRLEFVGTLGPYELHGRIWLAFPGIARGTKQPFLFRADVLPAAGRLVTRALVRSSILPALDMLGEGATILSPPSPFDSRWPRTRCCDFSYVRTPRMHRSRRITSTGIFAVRSSEKARQAGRPVWRGGAHRVAASSRADSGFCVSYMCLPSGANDEAVTRGPALSQRRPRLVRWEKEKAGREYHARHDGIDFEGLLRVEEPGAFARALANGIGPGKVAGFGLLSVKAP